MPSNAGLYWMLKGNKEATLCYYKIKVFDNFKDKKVNFSFIPSMEARIIAFIPKLEFGKFQSYRRRSAWNVMKGNSLNINGKIAYQFPQNTQP